LFVYRWNFLRERNYSLFVYYLHYVKLSNLILLCVAVWSFPDRPHDHIKSKRFATPFLAYCEPEPQRSCGELGFVSSTSRAFLESLRKYATKFMVVVKRTEKGHFLRLTLCIMPYAKDRSHLLLLLNSRQPRSNNIEYRTLPKPFRKYLSLQGVTERVEPVSQCTTNDHVFLSYLLLGFGFIVFSPLDVASGGIGTQRTLSFLLSTRSKLKEKQDFFKYGSKLQRKDEIGENGYASSQQEMT